MYNMPHTCHTYICISYCLWLMHLISYKSMDGRADRQADRQTDRYRQTNRQTDKQTDRVWHEPGSMHTDRCRSDKQTDRQGLARAGGPDRHTDRHR